jgi:hypothetical protein
MAATRKRRCAQASGGDRVFPQAAGVDDCHNHGAPRATTRLATHRIRNEIADAATAYAALLNRRIEPRNRLIEFGDAHAVTGKGARDVRIFGERGVNGLLVNLRRRVRF